MKKFIDWLKTSNRWKHLAGGFLIGACSDTHYCALYAAIIAGCCLEYKDKAHGGTWDWIDLGLTVGSACLGRLTHIIIGL